MVHSADDSIGVCSILNPGMHDMFNFPLSRLGKIFKSSMCGESQGYTEIQYPKFMLFCLSFVEPFNVVVVTIY